MKNNSGLRIKGAKVEQKKKFIRLKEKKEKRRKKNI